MRSTPVALPLLLLACTLVVERGTAQERPGAAAQALPAAITLPPALDRVLRDYEAAWSARDADALTALFAPDGFVLRPGHPPAHGHEAIRRAYATSGGPLVLRAYAWATDGDIGWIVGGYTSHADRPDGGKYVLALRRVPDGRWLIAADMDNGNS